MKKVLKWSKKVSLSLMDEGVVSDMVNYFEWLHSAFRCILSLENCGHLDKDLSTSSNPYLKKSLSTLSNEDTL